MTILKAFGPRAKEIAHGVDQFVHCTEIVTDYIKDTINAPGLADYELERAVRDLRKAADQLDAIDAKIKAARAAARPAPRIPVLTYGQHA